MGVFVVPDPIKDISFISDESDRKFYEVAKFTNAILVTGNLKHYPKENNIVNANMFRERYL